jgi:hypothetical protein
LARSSAAIFSKSMSSCFIWTSEVIFSFADGGNSLWVAADKAEVISS